MRADWALWAKYAVDKSQDEREKATSTVLHNRELDFKGTSVATAYMDKWCKLKVAMEQEKP